MLIVPKVPRTKSIVTLLDPTEYKFIELGTVGFFNTSSILNLNSTDFKIGDSALKKKFNRLLKEIEFDLNKKRNVFQTFNKDYKINTKILNKFKKFKFIIIIGMGGSTLGAEAIYSFLKSKIKKDIYFLNNLEINKLKEISNKKNN